MLRPSTPTRLHASCGAREGEGVLLIGPPGSGKSDLLLRLIDRGFGLVADDQVDIAAGEARAPETLAGLLEIRGLGIVRLPHQAQATLVLVAKLQRGERLPMPARYDSLDLPMISLDPWTASAPLVIEMALDGLRGTVPFAAGAFG